jgi:catechol 2,3-dioxygenase-like lactoylglutathione lyase family enzyme
VPSSERVGSALCEDRSVPIHSLAPYAHVADIHRSIAFYRRLGLEVQNRHFDGEVLAWAFLSTSTPDRRAAAARLMIAAADAPIDASKQAVLFYCWTDDAPSLHAELEAAGVAVGPIEHPFYMRAGEFEVVDPDGYVVLVGQLDAVTPSSG